MELLFAGGLLTAIVGNVVAYFSATAAQDAERRNANCDRASELLRDDRLNPGLTDAERRKLIEYSLSTLADCDSQ